MFDNIIKFFKKFSKEDKKDSKETAKERLHLVLMQDRANVSADFLELMKQEIIDVIKKYIEVDEKTIDVRLTTKTNEDGSNGTPSLYANIPILNIRNDMKVENYNFALQSDGSIIAHKIEEPVEEEKIEESTIVNEENPKESILVNEKNIDKNEEEKIDSLISENLEDTENTFVENVNEFSTETIESESFSKIEERQENIVNQIIPAIENIAKNEESIENVTQNENQKKAKQFSGYIHVDITFPANRT